MADRLGWLRARAGPRGTRAAAVLTLVGFYGAGELVGYQDFTHVPRALEEFLARPAVKRGLEIPKRA